MTNVHMFKLSIGLHVATWEKEEHYMAKFLVPTSFFLSFQILHAFKDTVGEETWTPFWNHCPDMLRERLRAEYNL